jgi:transposase
MSVPFAGVDISKGTFHFNILHKDKEKKKQFSNSLNGFNNLLDFLKNCHFKQIHVCMEVTGTYYEALAEFLIEHGHLVSVIPPNQSAAFIQSLGWRSKTDDLDAKALRLFGEQRNPPLWQPLAPTAREFRNLVRRIEALTDTQTQEKNRVQEPHIAGAERASLERSLVFLAEEIERLKKELHDHVDKDPTLREKRDLLDSIPGLAEWSASRILAEIPDLQTTKSPKQWVSYAGLSPRKWESGTSVSKREKMSGVGSSRLRDALFMPVLSCLRGNNFIRDLATRLKERPGKEDRSVRSACMRKLLHVIFGVLKNGKPFDPALASG